MEKKQIKMSLKMALIIVFIIIIVIGIIAICIYKSRINRNINIGNIQTSTNNGENVNNYGECVEFSYKTINLNNKINSIEDKIISTYSELQTCISEVESKLEMQMEVIDESGDNISVLKYFENFDFDNNSLILWRQYSDQEKIEDVYKDENNNLTVLIKEREYIVTQGKDIPKLNCIIIPNVKGASVQFKAEKEKIDIQAQADEKPIIYLYPTEEKNVNVKLLKEKQITCSYPKYNNGWDVLANPDGNLKDLKTGRNLYSLYYEGENTYNFEVENEGFVVKSEDIAGFLEEKLAILGLTEREAEEFIVYWLPKLETNKYNYIRFATIDEINENMPLEINPKPDTLIRVLMTFKGLESPIKITEQKLNKQERTGFAAVEWGGTEIK